MICFPLTDGLRMKKKRKTSKQARALKTAYSTKRFRCPNCGVVYGTFCVKCRAINAKHKVPFVELVEDDGPGPRDPSPLEIKFRARAIFNKNMSEGKTYNFDNRKGNRKIPKRKRRRLWENTERIVRMFKLP